MKKKKFRYAYGEASRKKQEDLLNNYNSIKKKTLGKKRKRGKNFIQTNKDKYYDYTTFKKFKTKNVKNQKNELNQNSYINLKDSQNDDFKYNKLNNSDDTISSNSSISNDI